jgi:hypothetical protein
MDSSEHYPEPFGEALSYSSQRAAQIGSLVAAGAEVAARRKALSRARQAARDERELRALRDQEQAAQRQARAGWAPAHDSRWLAQADLLQTARTWRAAAPFADTDPAAEAAARKCEERLRTLHPYAMARYDRLRGEGASPLDAMGEAAPLFARMPHARPGQPSTHRRIGAGPAGPDARPAAGIADGSLHEPAPDQDPYQEAEHRGRQIVWRLQARAQAERGSELSPDELATALEASTSLPAEVIARLARADSEGRVAAAAERARAADLDHAATAYSARERGENLKAARRDTVLADTAGAHASADRTAAQLAAESFPCTAADGMRAAVTGSLHQPARSPARTAAQDTRRPSRSA